MGVKLFVGGHAGTIQGEQLDLHGPRMFSASHRPEKAQLDAGKLNAMLDSGAFSDSPRERLSPEGALERQLDFEKKAAEMWDQPFQASALVSYDLLIDETWVAGRRRKQRWTVRQAEAAVRETVEAARYLSSQRQRLAPRSLVLSAQGVDAIQYSECAAGVLQCAIPDDIFGFGGWCILGRHTTLLPEFWATIRLVLPMVAHAGVSRVHIFGVLWFPALGGLLWLTDKYGLSVSTDSTAPVLACAWKNAKKAGVRVASGYWRDNVQWWKDALGDLRSTQHYQEPPDIKPVRQLRLIHG